MTAVFISSERVDKDVMPLFSLLSRTAKVSAVFDSFTKIVKDADFLLLPLKSGTLRADPNCSAVIFEDSEALQLLPKGCTVLCFCDRAAVRCSGQDRQIISCGMHNKDTVTLSSLEKGKPVLSVQRRLIAFSGEEIDAGDFPLITFEKDDRALMAAAVLLLLDGRELPQDIFCS